jgi:hypothetical protein
MNAQQLIQETPAEESFDYSVFFKSPIKSQIVISGGDKFVARQEIKHPAVDTSKGFSPLPSGFSNSLMPRTFNFTKKQEAITNLETSKAFKDLGIEVL